MTERQPTAAFQGEASDALRTPFSGGERSTAMPHASSVLDGGALPRAFGRYELRSLLGCGGMGRVYLAHDPQLDRLVALKMPNPVADVAEWRARFLAEARSAATLTHPNVCPIYDVGEVDGQPYLTMGYIEGETLAARLSRDGTMPVAAAVALLRTIAAAMHEAHRRNIVHRDLKPANLMLDAAGRPIIMDFGLAMRCSNVDDLRLTLTGVALGTPAYMPPEQASGEPDSIGPPADVYALGVILYELVTGRVPFKARSFGKLLAQIERDPPPAPSALNPQIDAALEAIILTALAKAPADRFASAGDMADALHRYHEGDLFGVTASFARPYRLPEISGAHRPPTVGAGLGSGTKQRRRLPWVVGAAVAAAACIAAAVIYVRTDYGDLEVRLSDPRAKVDVRVNGQEVTLTPDGGKPIRIRAGKGQKLEVSGPDFETVAESFDLKRGGFTIVQVALRKREVIAKVDPKKSPDDGKKIPEASKKVVEDPPRKKDKPPIAVFPEKPRLAEAAGWQIYTAATQADMQKWLDERKKAKHSVVWLDATQVGDRPLFTAVAALDARAPKWTAFLDVSAEDVNDGEALEKKIDLATHWVGSISAYLRGDDIRAVLLMHLGAKRWSMGPDVPEADLDRLLASEMRDGYVVRLLRPYLTSEDRPRYANCCEAIVRGAGTFKASMTPRGLADFLAEQRAAGFLPRCLAAVDDGGVRFTAVCEPNRDKRAWEVDDGLAAESLEPRTRERASAGLRPYCVTGYVSEGEVRYCAIWVKDPPRPVEYPIAPTLITAGAWQVLSEATQEQMQAWLDERRKEKHSVMWLDVVAVAGKPLYTAVAALDDRQPKWVAFLDLLADSVGDKSFDKAFDAAAHRVLSIGGYSDKGAMRWASLWKPGRVMHYFGVDGTLGHLEETEKMLNPRGVVFRLLRPYSVGPGAPRLSIAAEQVVGERAANYVADATPASMSMFLEAKRDAGERVLSFVAYPHDGELRYAVVGAANPEKLEWEIEHGITVDKLRTGMPDRVKTGFHPASVTAVPWDGAVRHAVIWVKTRPVPSP